MNNIKIVTKKIEHPEHTITTIVPAKTEEVIEYFCEVPGCGFTTKDKQRADEHYGIEHTIRKQCCVEEHIFLYFDCAVDMDLWRKAMQQVYYVQAIYTQPGWYMKQISQNRDDDELITLVYIDNAIINTKKKLKNIIQDAYKIKQFICEIEKMKEGQIK